MKKLSSVLLFVGVFTLISCGQIDANQAKLDEAHEALTLPLSHDEMSQVTADFVVPAFCLHEIAISWASNNPNIARINEQDELAKTHLVSINRPEIGASAASIKLTAYLMIIAPDTNEPLTKTKEFNITVIPLEADPAMIKLDAAYEALVLSGSDEPLDQITTDFSIPEEGLNGVKLAWTSSNSLVAEIGTLNEDEESTRMVLITRPAVNEAPVAVILTATLSILSEDDLATML
ncbi:MAG: hypothetical protein LBR37_03970, partial [Erysipelotrichaceae bacterium]|nr:hypothetical protein [Erysipelotrichaceae bacterium]